ncbi:MAG: hypothetical protein Q9M26_06590 [Mariprofundales bacterium]|nr:hypothetical protein [Mariprofundales bacterium]
MPELPPTEALLIAGSDPRLSLDPTTGANHYLCRPTPDSELLCFGSSTASTISPRGLAIADRLRNQLAEEMHNQPPEQVFAHHITRIQQALRAALQLEQATSIHLTESGTSAHRLAVAQIPPTHPLQVLMVEASETGRGVPTALADNGNHCREIAIRHADGAPRASTAIDDDFRTHTQQAIEAGRQVLLVLVDQSKSGIIAPSLPCARKLRDQFPERVQLLVDGCQFRFSTDTLRNYLKHGLMVAITGSKFLAGPSFSAALLIPPRHAREGWNPAFPQPPTTQRIHPGLLVRWQVALDTLQQLQQLIPSQIDGFTAKFNTVITDHLQKHPLLAPLPTTAAPLPTIFPFRLRPQPDAPWCSLSQTLTIYQHLQHSGTPRIQFGRPIRGGLGSDGTPIGALRLCLSARIIVDALANNQQDATIDQAITALDRATEATRESHFPRN